MSNNFTRHQYGYGLNWAMADKKEMKRGGTAPHFEPKTHQPSGNRVGNQRPHHTNFNEFEMDDDRHDIHDRSHSSHNTIDLDELEEHMAGIEGMPHHEDPDQLEEIGMGQSQVPVKQASTTGTATVGGPYHVSKATLPVNNMHEDADSLLLDSFLNEDSRPSPKQEKGNHKESKGHHTKEELLNSMHSIQRPNSSYSMLRANKGSKKVNIGGLYQERAATIQTDSHNTGLNDQEATQAKKNIFTRQKEKLGYANPPATAGPVRGTHGLMRPPSRQKSPQRALVLELPAGKAGKIDNFMPIKSMFTNNGNEESPQNKLREDPFMAEDFDNIKIENKLDFSHLKDRKGVNTSNSVRNGTYLDTVSPKNTFGLPYDTGKKILSKNDKLASVYLPATADGKRKTFSKPRPEESYQPQQQPRLSVDKIYHPGKGVPLSAGFDEFQDTNWKKTGDQKRGIASAKGYGLRKDIRPALQSGGGGGKMDFQHKEHFGGMTSMTNAQKNMAMTDNYFKKNTNNTLPFNSSLERDFLNLFAN